ncbi:hypothetical protein [Bradyrhizobium sp. USDA 223]|uniref:hypothetical protein n=1 Tax=Bradyrhizobium sp. USDA 223 TaxID=3156306 RepID=UPI0038385305
MLRKIKKHAWLIVMQFSAVLLLLSGLLPSAGLAKDKAPPAALMEQFLLNTFSSDADFSVATVDQSLTFASGFKWYNSNIVKQRPQEPNYNKFNPDGSITTFSPAYGLGIVSAANIAQDPGFVGVAFGGGGYFEAELKFDPATLDLKEGQWPAFWTVSLESSAALPGQQWKGQPPGYNHTVEFDIFEYLYSRTKAPNVYGASGHDFFGIYGVTCPPARCKADSIANERVAPIGTRWNEFHKFGMLWVPASDDRQGKVVFYFDDQPIGSQITWEKFVDQSPPVINSSKWKLGVVDRQHLILILGSSKSSPITVRSVNVWQATDRFNMRN